MTEREKKNQTSRSLGAKVQPRRLGVAPGGTGDRARDASFTPGPWEVYDEYGIVGVRAADLRIAMMDNEDESLEEYDRAHANADLCAAAPKMLHALHDAAVAIGWHMPAECKCSGDFRCVSHDALRVIRAAIAAATGGTP